MPGDPCPSLLRSPRTNLRALLERGGASRSRVPDDLSLPPPLDAALDAAVDSLIPADAENKLFFRKLYLVLDLDETLVYSQRMEPGAKPVGTQIFVRGHPFDMVPRPGLQHFLRTAHQQYVVYLYTMGDQEYTEAVLRVIDPEGVYFQGGVCCWRPHESRTVKTLARAVCDRRMAIIVDDTVDVWTNDLANLCVTRRFVGDQLDDGLQLLSWQLDTAHRAFFASAPSEGYSLDPAALDTPRAPPSVFSVLADTRGQILAGCTIALTGVVNGLGHEEGLENVPLGVLIRLYGGQTTMHVEQATHLVARRKDGWKASPKIRRALARLQDGDPGFYAVWDHWLLDTLSSWQRQAEGSYSIEMDDERAPSPLSRQQQEEGRLAAEAGVPSAEPAMLDGEKPEPDDGDEGGDGMPPRKRPRAELGVIPNQLVSV